jgi:hypothetical protein
MQRFDGALGGLRSTLLAACGLGVGACTPTTPTPETTAKLDPETPVEPFSEQEPKPDPQTTAALCANPTPLLRDGQDTGYITCADGAVNRASAFACAKPVAAPACRGTEADRSCDTHANCTDRPHGFCMSGRGMRGEYCGCVYPCLNDGECGAGEACMCPELDENGRGQPAAECAPAECKVNADCPSGECGATVHFNGCHHDLSLHCREAGDACRSDASCTGDHQTDCAALQRGEEPISFQCAGFSCVIGRPLTVDSGVRVANMTSRRWGATQLEGLSPASDRAQYWLGVARMEHASVASFARFVHELMIFAAPPSLLTDALAAAADEVRHAEQTFALASAYAGEPIGPGALRVDDLRATRDPELFVTRLIVEGCVGETLGVAEVLALLEHEVDPVLRPRLEQIAADETRHAALAWRTLRWFAERVDPAVIERAFEQALSQVERVDDEATDPTHGRLGTAAKRRIRARAIESVIDPLRNSVMTSLAGSPARHANPAQVTSRQRLVKLAS